MRLCGLVAAEVGAETFSNDLCILVLRILQLNVIGSFCFHMSYIFNNSLFSSSYKIWTLRKNNQTVVICLKWCLVFG